MSGSKSPRKCRAAIPRPKILGRLHRRDPRRPRRHRDLVSDPPRPRNLEVDRSLREARPYERSAANFFARPIPSRSIFPARANSPRSVFERVDLPRPLHDAFFEALPKSLCRKHDAHRAADPGGLGTSRRHTLARSDATRDRTHAGRRALPRCVAPAVAAVETSTANLPKLAGDGEITSPLATLVKPGQLRRKPRSTA